MSSYRVRLWCRDCTGQDPQGCYDGGTELIREPHPSFEVRKFATLREAIDAGYEATRGCAPLEFDVEIADGENEGDEIEYGGMTEAEIDAFAGPTAS